MDNQSGGMSTTRDEVLGVDLTADIHLDPTPATPVDLHDPRQRAVVEAAIANVPGVVGARLVPGFDRQIDEVHVLTVIDRSPKQTVRDIQTVLMARFGVPTDHRVISVVRMDEGEGMPALPVRPIIEEVGSVRSGTSIEAVVALRDRDEVHRGSATDAATATGRQRAVAHATLAAVRPMLDERTLVELEGVEIIEVAARGLAAVVLQIRAGRTEFCLSGTAMVHDTADDAIARAVLDALNRTLEGRSG